MMIEFDTQPFAKGQIMTVRTLVRRRWWQFWKLRTTEAYNDYVISNVHSTTIVMRKLEH